MKMDYFILSGILLIACLSQTDGYIVTVDADAEECFFEKVEAGTKLGEYIYIFATQNRKLILFH